MSLLAVIRRRRPRRRPPAPPARPGFAIAVALAATIAGSGASPAAAELVVLTDASILKVSGYAVEGETAVLTFGTGGSLRMSILRVERVVDDEVVPEPEKGAEKLERTAESFPVRFRDDLERPDAAYADVVWTVAKKHDVNPELVLAVIRAESAGNPRAISRKGARGLMQLMPATGRRYGVAPADLWKPECNIDAGVRYLAFLAKKFDGDLSRILAGYNAGEGAVDRFGGIPPYRETRGYVKRIFGYLGLPVASLALATGRVAAAG